MDDVVEKIGEAPETDLGTVAELAGVPEWVSELVVFAESPMFIVLIVVLTIWSAIWKGIALWKSGRNNQLPWFVVLFIFNTAGILEILYLVFWQKKKKRSR
jgi:methionyl-tRNA synthetase